MRCLYEILDIERDVDDHALKVAYKKAAFRWHPDKNQNNLQEAEENFKEIQNAYEVLSDRHERAWYDGHRTEILRQASRHQAGGGESFARGQAPEEEIVLFPFFSATCFNGYKDGPAGYYGVYEDLFARLDGQEQSAEANEQQAASSREPAPKFGSSSAEWTQISGFYSHWGAFLTAKSFAWADKYNTATAPNRKVRRLMEEENRKLRKNKRREFSETVRELVAFVKKRDKRVATHQAEEAKRRQEEEAKDKARREEERRVRLQRAREFEEAAWANAEAEAESDDESAEEGIPDELYCLACDKLFRTPNAMANHNKSKKHLEKVSLLREVLAADDSLKCGFENGTGTEDSAAVEASGSASADSVGSVERGDNLASEHSNDDEPALPSSSSEMQPGDEDAAANGTSAGASDRVFHGLSASSRERGGADSDSGESESRSEGESSKDMLAALLNMQRQKTPQQGVPLSHPEDDDALAGLSGSPGRAASLENQEALLGTSNDPTVGSLDPEELLEKLALRDNSEGEESCRHTVQKKAAKKSRRRKKAGNDAQKAPLEEENESSHIDLRKIEGPYKRGRRGTQPESKTASIDAPNACSTCGASFTSRTKLFQHIRESSHAALRS